jgi:hypothetical protein
MAGLKVKIGADTSALASGMGRAKGLVGGFGTAIGKLGIGRVALGLGGLAAGFVGLGASIRGVKGALDLGGSMSDLSERTGIAVDKLMVMRQAFSDSGIAAEKLGPIINKMQKGITDAGAGLSTQVRAFDRLGMSYDDLAGKDPAAQFELIRKGLVGIEDPTLRAGTAMDIFGRSGGELQALFSDGAAMQKAMATVGTQAEILRDNAANFDRTSDLLKSAGSKLQGFFVGLADYINPVLLPVLEQINKLDLARYGQSVGRAVSMVVELFRSGSLPGLLADGLRVAAKSFVNTVAVGLKGAVMLLWAGLKEVPGLLKSSFAVLTDKNTWLAVGNYLSAAVNGALAGLLEVTGAKGAAKDLRGSAEADLVRGENYLMMANAGSLGDLGDQLAAAGVAMRDAFKAELDKDGPLDASEDFRRMDRTLDRIRSVVEKRRLADDAPGAGGEGKEQKIELPKTAPKVEPPRVTTLARVGGSSLTRRSVDLAVERNRVLERIERNTRGGSVAVWA